MYIRVIYSIYTSYDNLFSRLLHFKRALIIINILDIYEIKFE